MEDTIYNLPNEEYHHGEGYKDYLSSSQLKHYLVSPKYAKWCFDNPEEDKINPENAELGSLFHAAMESLANTGSLEQFHDELFIFNPPINGKTGQPFGSGTKAYQVALEFAKTQNNGKTPASKAKIDLVETMVNELLRNCGETSSQVRKILKWGKAEVSHFVEYQGAKFKFRPDLETKTKIIDWKTLAVDDLHEDTIAKTIIKFGYDISAAFYQFFCHEITGQWKSFYWVMQQKQPPYDAVMICADNWAYSLRDEIVELGSGALKFSKLLQQYIYCTTHKTFPGAEIMIEPGFKNRRIMTVEIPTFERNKLFEYYNND
jgi:hypothetical protein